VPAPAGTSATDAPEQMVALLTVKVGSWRAKMETVLLAAQPLISDAFTV